MDFIIVMFTIVATGIKEMVVSEQWIFILTVLMGIILMTVGIARKSRISAIFSILCFAMTFVGIIYHAILYLGRL